MPKKLVTDAMRANLDNRAIPDLLAGGPSVGALMELCEQNYQLVLSLASDLKQMTGLFRSHLHNSAPLHLEVLEQTHYTTLIRLTHFFAHDGKPDADPDIQLRLYHDAHQTEVVSLKQSILPLEGLYHHPGLEQKWRANQFVSRWLQFCLLQGHGFGQPELSEHRVVEPVSEILA